MPREILPRSALHRHLQAISSQTTNTLDIATSAIHCKPRKRKFSQLDNESEEDVGTYRGKLLGVEDGLIAAVLLKPQEASPSQVYRDSDKEVCSFKGRLLGVEDGLIDAIESESYPIYRTTEPDTGSSTTSNWYLGAEVVMAERQSLRRRKGPNNFHALPAQQNSKASVGPLGFQAPMAHSSHRHPGFSDRRRCSIRSEDSEACDAHSPCPWRIMKFEDSTSAHNTLSEPSVHISSPSRSELDLPEGIDIPTELNDIVVDSIVLDKSDDDTSPGTWDLSSWRTLEFTLSDLLMVRGPGGGW